MLGYLAEKFEANSIYPEKAVNALCMQWHTFNDYFILRRERSKAGCFTESPTAYNIGSLSNIKA